MRNLKHLANMVETCDGQFLRFDLEYQQVNICVIFAVVGLRVKCRGRTAVMDWMGLSQWILYSVLICIRRSHMCLHCSSILPVYQHVGFLW